MLSLRAEQPVLLQKAAAHAQEVWILRQHRGPHGDIDLAWLKGVGAQLVVELVLYYMTPLVELKWPGIFASHATPLSCGG
jgi:hypothetical protein